MLDGWLKLAQWITAQLGIPGALISAGLIYVVYLLREERASHEGTRKQIDAINEKRLELLSVYLKTMQEFKASLDTLTMMMKK